MHNIVADPGAHLALWFFGVSECSTGRSTVVRSILKKIQYKIELLQYKTQVEGLSFCFALIPPQVPLKVYLASPKLLDPLQASAAMQSISCFRGARGSTSGWKWIRKSVDEGATVHECLVRQTNRKGTLG